MRIRFFCVLLGLVMGMVVAGAPASASLAPKGEKSKSEDLYTLGRRIGVLKKGGGTCAPVPGWKLQTLRELAIAHAKDGEQYRYEYARAPQPAPVESKSEEKMKSLYHKYDLDRFCIYTSLGHGDFQQPANLAKAEPDRMAVTATAATDLGLGPLGDQTWESLAGHFLDQVGKVRLGTAQKQRVRLVFVDTHPTSEGPPSRFPVPPSWHGFGMAHLGNEIVCGHDTAPEDCPIHIATRLALRYGNYSWDPGKPDDLGNDRGGHQGRVGDLAVAILAEIERWQATEPKSKLILNLSVGWDGEYRDLDVKKETELEASSQAVYKALRVASHLGVLVIASSGNRSGGETFQPSLLPAAWESHPPTWLPYPFSKKIAYAVGGIDWQGLPLPNTRPAGLPWRVAYGDHAVARTSSDGAGEPTKMYTGTSVSAVAVSSMAAVVWELRPDWKPAQVMRWLKYSAEPLPDRATFYAWPKLSWLIGTPHLRRLSLCPAVLRLCGPDKERCPALESVDCRLGKHPPADLSGIAPPIPSPVAVSPLGPPACDPRTRTFKGSGPVAPTSGCPMETLPDMNLPSLSQTLPPDTPCPTCTVVPDKPAATALADLTSSPGDPSGGSDTDQPKSYSLAAAIDPDWLALAPPNTQISSAILVVECRTGSPVKERLDLSPQFSALLASAKLVAPPSLPLKLSFGAKGGRRSLAGCTASLDFNLRLGSTDESSVQSAVYVDP
ncbi:MAG: S8 family serine peptidase [Thermoanaerobaculia bacterium]